MLKRRIWKKVLPVGLLALSSQALHAVDLSDKCPKTGLYQDNDGYCRPVQPYTATNFAYHGLWKMEQKQIRLSPKKIDLGRLLFFDPILSGAKNQSCASCHDPQRAFSGKRENQRNAPGLVNLAYNPKFFWDGRVDNASDQIKAPLLSPLEMANDNLESVLQRLNAVKEYQRLFSSIRPPTEKLRPITWSELVDALDSFQKSLITFTAPYDRYVLGDHKALSVAQVRGLTLFRSFATRCSECHTPPQFTNHQILTIGAPGEARAFKVPTLRQISKTAPYMHRGAFASLEEVVSFYNQGGGRSDIGISGRNTHWHVRPIGLSRNDEADLVEFLNSLTDEGWRVELPHEVPSGLSPIVGQ